MICPECKSDNISTINSRPSKKMVRRRKQCESCGHRFSTYELHKNILEFYETQLKRLQELEKFQRSKQNDYYRRPWTKSELDLLLLMYFDQTPIREMAEKLNRTYSSVENKICKMRDKGQLKIS